MYPTNAYSIRRPTDLDEGILHRLAELDSQRRFAGPALIAESGGIAVAAISLVDGRVARGARG